MSILLTGSTGYIGSRFLKKISETYPKQEIRLIARRNVKGFKTFKCDFLNDAIPNDALNSVDTVYHIAGRAHDLDNKKLENEYIKINTNSTINLANLAIAHNIKSFIFLSSVKASEDNDIYGVSKRKAEIELLKIFNNSGIHHSILRPSLVYSSNLKGNLKLMFDGINAGWFPPLPETFNKRSMVHLDDLIDAMIFVRSNPKTNGKILTVTDGNAYSSREIYNVLCKMAKKNPPNWEVPIIFFKLISMLGKNFKFKIDKIFGNDFHSSKELERLGFKTKKTFLDI